MQKKHNVEHTTHNDGVLFYGKVLPKYGKGRKRIGEEFVQEGKLYYEILSIRDSDNMIANNIGYTIDKKVRTHFKRDLKTSHKVKINDSLYDVVSLDNDRLHSFLYLQKVGV